MARTERTQGQIAEGRDERTSNVLLLAKNEAKLDAPSCAKYVQLRSSAVSEELSERPSPMCVTPVCVATPKIPGAQ